MAKVRLDKLVLDRGLAESRQRASALIRAGVSSERVTVEAVADDQPVYSEAMPTGEDGNRRAEIFFLR